MGLGIFDGIWGGISNTLGRGADQIAEQTGAADKQRQQQLNLANIQAQAAEDLAAQKTKMYIIAGVILLIVVIVIIKSRRS